jgi:hypothetical protein
MRQKPEAFFGSAAGGKFYFFRLGLLADLLGGFADGIGGVLIKRFMASSKLMPCNRRSMDFGMA